MALVVKNPPARAEDMRHRFDPWIGKITRRRAWQPTPVFLPGESQGQRGLVGYRPKCHKESDTTEATSYKHAQVMWTTVQQLEEASKNRLFLGLYEWKAMIKGGMSEVMPVRLAGARSHS